MGQDETDCVRSRTSYQAGVADGVRSGRRQALADVRGRIGEAIGIAYEARSFARANDWVRLTARIEALRWVRALVAGMEEE